MTGFGEASLQTDALSIAIEMRTVNNRYLKVTLRAAEPYNLLEPEFEKVIRKTIRRGSMQIQLRIQRQGLPQDYRINAAALRGYLAQLRPILHEAGLAEGGQAMLGQVLALPGVVPEASNAPLQLEEDWPLIEQVLGQAIRRLQAMRLEEGEAMGRELLQLRDHIAAELAKVRDRAPLLVEGYRDRVLDRVRSLLGELDVKIDRSDLIKEVAIFAERADIAEEVVRLSSHLDQFKEIVREPESAGRKLEFLVQEMFRETNTIGSKASDVEISRHVVEIKSALEKIRELVQNVE
jgi:uncharacterized protein (TIGR00255 family)